jgi:hypothetical protein
MADKKSEKLKQKIEAMTLSMEIEVKEAVGGLERR